MTKYPLTYAVFYKSLIEPYTYLNIRNACCILLTGNPADPDNDSIPFSKNVASRYINGDMPINDDLTKNILCATTQKLVPRIQELQLFDMPAILSKAKKLISISDISEEFRNELLILANHTKEEEFFIAELFKISLKTHNKKLRIRKPERDFLKNLQFKDITPDEKETSSPLVEIARDISQENGISPANYAKVLHDIGISPVKKGLSINRRKANIKSTEKLNDSPFYDFMQVIVKYRDTKPHNYKTSSNYTIWSKLELPRDYEELISYIAPVISGQAVVNLTASDLIYYCHLDINSKTIKHGHIKLLETAFSPDDMTRLKTALQKMPPCSYALINITCEPEISTHRIDECIELINKQLLSPFEMKYGVQHDHYCKNRIFIRALFYVSDDPIRFSPSEVAIGELVLDSDSIKFLPHVSKDDVKKAFIYKPTDI